MKAITKQLQNPQKRVVKLWRCGVCKAVYNSKEDMALRSKNGRKVFWVGFDFNAPKQCQCWGHVCCAVLVMNPKKSLGKHMSPAQTEIRIHTFVEQKRKQHSIYYLSSVLISKIIYLSTKNENRYL